MKKLDSRKTITILVIFALAAVFTISIVAGVGGWFFLRPERNANPIESPETTNESLSAITRSTEGTPLANPTIPGGESSPTLPTSKIEKTPMETALPLTATQTFEPATLTPTSTTASPIGTQPPIPSFTPTSSSTSSSNSTPSSSSTPSSRFTPSPRSSSTPTQQPSSTPTSTSSPSPTSNYGAPMAFIAAGAFLMGGDAEVALAECEELEPGGDCQLEYFLNEEPRHTVYLDAFYLDLYEVTNLDYRECVAAGACDLPIDQSSYTRESYYGNPDFDDYPVIYVTWGQAQTYCQWRGARLPTEAEWEKAARGIDTRKYPWGEQFNGNIANFCDTNCTLNYANDSYDDGQSDTAPVGAYPQGVSPYGLYDMAGNVWEWVADWFLETFYYDSPLHNPLGPESGTYRSVRGGSWSNPGDFLRTSSRSWDDPVEAYDDLGFRCARSK